MLGEHISSYGCMQEVRRAKKYVRVAWGTAESNSSFLREEAFIVIECKILTTLKKVNKRPY